MTNDSLCHLRGRGLGKVRVCERAREKINFKSGFTVKILTLTPADTIPNKLFI